MPRNPKLTDAEILEGIAFVQRIVTRYFDVQDGPTGRMMLKNAFTQEVLTDLILAECAREINNTLLAGNDLGDVKNTMRRHYRLAQYTLDNPRWNTDRDFSG